ncbi:gag-pol polyprotein [Tanacetum coccineum]
MEYLVKDSKRRAFWSLNEDILKITILKTNTPYPSRKIRRIRACTHQRPQRNKAQYVVSRETQYAVFKIYYVNILEDIKRGPYSKKSSIRHIQPIGYACLELIVVTDQPVPVSQAETPFLPVRIRIRTNIAEYGVSTSIGYGVSNFLSNTAYSIHLINTSYPIPLDTTYRSSVTEAEPKSSANELLTPYKELEREFRSSRRHFKTLSLDELRSPDFNLLSDQEYSKEEVAETMAEIMEQYMSKTRADYGSGVARSKIEDKDNFELKGQFLKELRTNTFSGLDHEDVNEHIEKVLEIVDLFHIPNITEVVLFYNGLDVPTRQIIDSRGAIPSKTAVDAKIAIQEMAEYSQKWHNETSRVRSTETSNGLAAIQAQLNYLGREIKKRKEKLLKKLTTRNLVDLFKEGDIEQQLQDAAIRNQGASIKTLEIQISQMSKILQERGFGSLPSSTETNPRDQVMSISTIIEAYSYSIRHIGSSQYVVSTGQNSTLLYKSRQTTVPFPSRLDNHYYEEEEGNYGPKFAEAYGDSHINDTIPQKEKDPGNRTVKYQKGIAENVLVRIGKFTFLVDFIILDMPEDIKVPLILERPFLCTARDKIDVYKRKITLRVEEERIVFTSVKLASCLIKRVYMLSLTERMELNLEARLIGETLVLNRSLDPFLEDYIELNNLNEPFELRRNQGDDLMPTIEEGEVIEEFRTRDDELDIGIDDYPSYCDYDTKIRIDFLEDMDAYRDEGMGDVIIGEPFLREVGIKARRFDGMITIYNGDDEVTYQMVRSHSRFKHHTNKQCNKIPPLLKDLTLSEFRQWKNGSHAGTLTCMRWNNEKDVEDKSNLKTSL